MNNSKITDKPSVIQRKKEQSLNLTNAHKKKVLIIEDNEINRTILAHVLEDEYEIIQACHGEEGIEQLEKYGDAIDLIVLDINMPVMDGYTFLSVIRKNPDYVNIPVIAVTLNDSESSELEALKRGANDFITKPYKPLIIKHRIASLINFRESSAMANLLRFDVLTKVYSKDYFYNRATEMVKVNPHIDYDVICTDIENLNLINDIFGYQYGNELLCYLAKLCEAIAEENNGLCARIGGDTFVMLIERRDDYSEEFFNVYIDDLNNSFNKSQLNVNFGIFQIIDRNIPINLAGDRALLATESVQGKYGKNFAYYRETFLEEKMHVQQIYDNMAKSLENKEFKIFFQPKYSLQDGSIVEAESLARWITSDNKLLMPNDFIPIFEKSGFISQLDYYIFEEACRVISESLKNNKSIVPVSVNISRFDLFNPELPEKLLTIVEKYGLEPKCVPIEITESAYTDNPESIAKAVLKLRESGFVIQMDDFGSGFSSLNMLNELAIDVLKLDIKFIQTNLNKDSDKSILNYVIDMAKWLDLIVVAEGVEVKEHVEKLKKMKCDYAQGYYYSRPLPEDAFLKLLEESSK